MDIKGLQVIFIRVRTSVRARKIHAELQAKSMPPSDRNECTIAFHLKSQQITLEFH